jgi:hypothetical protein
MEIKYWEEKEAIEELKRRMEDKKLQRKIEKHLRGCPIPKGVAVLGRHIATARLEDIQFQKRTRKLGIPGVWFTFTKDQYIPWNPSKNRIVKLRVFHGFGRNGGIKEEVVKICPVQQKRRISMEELVTFWGERVVGFHKRAREEIIGETEEIDGSEWLKSFGKARDYYFFYLLGAVGNFILFESFNSPGFQGQLDRFNQTVVLPALSKIKQKGFPDPLIVYHPNSRLPERIVLECYPPKIKKFIPGI